jgi:hypothetical protein
MPAPEDPLSSDPLRHAGAYEYMSEGYYACQDAELAGGDAMPTCADALDAYVVPVALEKAAKAGVPVPEWLLTSEYFPVPAVCYGVNPFSRKYAVVRDEASRGREARRLTWNHKYVICCQRIAPTTEIAEFRMVCGKTGEAEFADWAERVFAVFRVPVATVRLLRGARLEFSAIEPLPYESLTPTERAWAGAMLRG